MTFSSEPAPASIYAPTPPPKKRKVWKIVLLVAAIVVALIVIAIVALVLLVSGATKDAQKVSDQFIVAIQNNDSQKAFALTGPTFQKATTPQELGQLETQLSKLVSKDKVSPSGKSINASTDNGKIAVFTYKLAGVGRGPVYFKTEIKKENGAWKVLNFRSSETPLKTNVE